MELGPLIIFSLVYLGMILGNLPGLALDRAGIALLGAIAFITLQNIPLSQVGQYIDFSALAILFSLMIISAQFSYSGFYTHVIERIEKWNITPSQLLLVLILISALLSAVLLNRISLIAAGLLLLNHRMASQKMLNFIDWQLLVLFIGLFILNRGFLNTHALDAVLKFLGNHHVDIRSPFWIFLISAALSNIVSNVPALMLLLPFIRTYFDGSVLAISSTLAGNMFIIGSIANIIVISQAARFGIKISWKKHLR